MPKVYEPCASEIFWVGPKRPELHTVYRMQFDNVERRWLATPAGTELDPNYSEFSVRIHNPNARSLSFINRTIAILPKSKLREIYNLIGEYLNEIDKKISK
jgi:hypothetical protein